MSTSEQPVLIIFCHPGEDSYNHAIARAVTGALESAGIPYRFHDLYAEEFQPVLTRDEIQRRFTFDSTVQSFFGETKQARGFCFIHPDWWGQPPAMLKGWLDRVFRPGAAYDFEGPAFMEKRQVPLLSGRRGLVFSTTDVQRPTEGYPLERLWEEQIFAFCGVEPAEIHIFYDIRNSSYRERRRWLSKAGETARRLFA